MSRETVRYVGNVGGSDDRPLFAVRRDLSGGVNSHEHASHILEKEAETLNNVDIGIRGERRKAKGSVFIGDDVGANSIIYLGNFRIQGATDQLLSYENTTLRKWTGSGNHASIKLISLHLQ